MPLADSHGGCQQVGPLARCLPRGITLEGRPLCLAAPLAAPGPTQAWLGHALLACPLALAPLQPPQLGRWAPAAPSGQEIAHHSTLSLSLLSEIAPAHCPACTTELSLHAARPQSLSTSCSVEVRPAVAICHGSSESKLFKFKKAHPPQGWIRPASGAAANFSQLYAIPRLSLS